MQQAIRIFCVAVIATFVAPFFTTAENLKPGDFVAVIGDSITEQKDYSVNIENYLLMCQPVTGLKAMQLDGVEKPPRASKTVWLMIAIDTLRLLRPPATV